MDGSSLTLPCGEWHRVLSTSTPKARGSTANDNLTHLDDALHLSTERIGARSVKTDVIARSHRALLEGWTCLHMPGFNRRWSLLLVDSFLDISVESRRKPRIATEACRNRRKSVTKNNNEPEKVESERFPFRMSMEIIQNVHGNRSECPSKWMRKLDGKPWHYVGEHSLPTPLRKKVLKSVKGRMSKSKSNMLDVLVYKQQ